MIILVDIGNTCLKWGTFLDGCFNFGGVVDYKQHSINTILSTICSNHQIERLLISNVGSHQLEDQICDWHLKEKAAFKMSFIQSEKEHACGLINAYAEPEKLGVDRWLAMIACWYTYRSAFALIACGTAITVDVVNHRGQHLGGLIIPGIHLMQSSLKTGTARCNVPTSGKYYPESSLLAQETHQAIETGTIFATVAFIERILDELQEDSTEELINIITGGDAQYLLPLLTDTYIYDQDTVLKGLAWGYANTL